MDNNVDEKVVGIPDYQREYYSWVYENPKLSKIFCKQIILDVITFGYSRKMIKSCVAEIEPRDTVLQIGVTFGSQIEEVAAKVGIYGEYDIIDVSPTQIKRCRDKYGYHYPFMRFINQDGIEPFKKKYDVIICYMLLHELPPVSRNKVINNALASLAPKGKVIFFDYNKSSKWQIFSYIIRVINRLYQPFAERMWTREIRTDVKNQDDFSWRKKTFFGNLYQKLVVSRKAAPY